MSQFGKIRALAARNEVIGFDSGGRLVGSSRTGWRLDELAAEGLPLAHTVALGGAIVRLLRDLHSHGVVHRRLSSRALFVDVFDTGPIVLLADLGDSSRKGSADTLDLLGPAGYTAPEQVDAPSTADPRSDVFALGAILYELTTGRPPFGDGPPDATVAAARAGQYDPPRQLRPELPAWMEAAIAGALMPELERRVPDCDTLLAMWYGQRTSYIDEGARPTLVVSPPSIAPPALWDEQTEESRWRWHPVLLGAGVVIALLVVGLAQLGSRAAPAQGLVIHSRVVVEAAP